MIYFLLLGTLAYWLALPPVGLWFLIFLVPVFWTFVIERPEPPRFRAVYLTAFVFWLASIWWIACPHPLTTIGLLALAGYLAFYWTLFFAASRIAVHRLRIPTVIAAPICWIGCEFLRNHLLGGFSFCSLEHTLYRQPMLIQIADIGGGYLVGGMIMLVGTMAAKSVNRSVVKSLPYIFGILAIGFAVLYYAVDLRLQKSPSVRVATLQGNIPVRLDGGQEQANKTFQQFTDLTRQAVHAAQSEGKPLKLIIWPETVCPIPVLAFTGSVKPDDLGLTDEESVDWQKRLLGFVQELDTPVLFGLSTYEFANNTEPKRLNSALLVDPKIDKTDFRYDKIRLVMFGEYVPFSEYLPNNFFLKTLCQEAGRGTQPVAMPITETAYASVNICFESTIPHFVRNQILTLKKQGKEPALLINMSNDGWFWFSQQIDQHLATHVFRAVENRRPYVTATNGGFSAIIDSRGNIKKIGNRREAEFVVDEVFVQNIETPIYHRIGDTPALGCLIAVVFLLFSRMLSKSQSTPTQPPTQNGLPAQNMLPTQIQSC